MSFKPENFDAMVGEAIAAKTAGGNNIMFVPPDRKFSEINFDTLSEHAKLTLPFAKREIFKDERDRIVSMISNIFKDMKKPDTVSEVRLNPEFSVSVSDEDIDVVLDAWLDGVDDE